MDKFILFDIGVFLEEILLILVIAVHIFNYKAQGLKSYIYV